MSVKCIRRGVVLDVQCKETPARRRGGGYSFICAAASQSVATLVSKTAAAAVDSASSKILRRFMSISQGHNQSRKAIIDLERP